MLKVSSVGFSLPVTARRLRPLRLPKSRQPGHAPSQRITPPHFPAHSALTARLPQCPARSGPVPALLHPLAPYYLASPRQRPFEPPIRQRPLGPHETLPQELESIRQVPSAYLANLTHSFAICNAAMKLSRTGTTQLGQQFRLGSPPSWRMANSGRMWAPARSCKVVQLEADKRRRGIIAQTRQRLRDSVDARTPARTL